MSPAVLTVTGLTVDYPGPVRAVDGVSFTLAAGEVLVLLGESGSGKTTVARTVLGLHGPAARVGGGVLLGTTDLRAASERELTRIRGRRIGYVAQDPTAALDPLRRIGSQLAEVLRRHGIAPGRRAARAAVPALLDAVGLADPERVARSHPHELSGGQRQRAAIALAIACGPELLLADEPTTALDVLLSAQVLDLFGRLREERGTALLLVTHDLDAARRVGGRVAVMREGRVVESGPAERVLSRPGHAFTAEPAAAREEAPR